MMQLLLLLQLSVKVSGTMTTTTEATTAVMIKDVWCPLGTWDNAQVFIFNLN